MPKKSRVSLVVNINGESPENLVRDYTDVAIAADNLITALCRAKPHGRDYQATSDINALKFDYDRNEDLCRMVREIKAYAVDSAIYIDEQQRK